MSNGQDRIREIQNIITAPMREYVPGPAAPSGAAQAPPEGGLPSGLLEVSPGVAVDSIGNVFYQGPNGEWFPSGEKLDKWQYQLLTGEGDAGASTYDPLDALRTQLALSEEQRAQEMHPLEMEAAGTNIEAMRQQMDLESQEMERRILDDRFTRAQAAQEAAVLAESLAASKRREAVSALRDMTEYLVPPGMEYIPGMGPGGIAGQMAGRAGYDYTPTPIQPVASVDFSQFTQANPQMDAAVQYLLQLEQQNRAV